LEALEKSDINHIRHVPDKAPEIKMIAMNSSSVDFNLDVWVGGDDVIYPRRTESRFLIMIYKALNENGITIPFPQLDIHVKEPVVVDKKDEGKT
jgi:small-conductance mechanosensitive channel